MLTGQIELHSEYSGVLRALFLPLELCVCCLPRAKIGPIVWNRTRSTYDVNGEIYHSVASFGRRDRRGKF